MTEEMTDQEREFLAQEELQKQQFDQQVAMNDPYLKQQQADFQASIIKSIKPAEDLEIIEMTLRGQVYDKENNLVQKYKPLMSDEGVSVMISFARSILNQNTTISFIEPRQIGKIMRGISDNVVLSLLLRWKEFEIAHKTNMDLINNVVLFPIFFALGRCSGGGERRWISKSLSESLSDKKAHVFEKTEGFMAKFKL